MPRAKRKREEAVTDPVPTARRRRSQVGHEPMENNKQAQVKNNEADEESSSDVNTTTTAKQQQQQQQQWPNKTRAASGAAAQVDIVVPAAVTVIANDGAETRSQEGASTSGSGNRKPSEAATDSNTAATDSTDAAAYRAQQQHDKGGTKARALAVASKMGNDHATEAEEKKSTSQAETESVITVDSAAHTIQMGVTAAASTSATKYSKGAPTKNLQTSQNPKLTRRQTSISSVTMTAEAGASEATASLNNNHAEESPATREARIRALLEHRKLLLLRVQQGKRAAQKRIDEIESADPSSKTVTDEQETIAFQEMTRTVTSLARKQTRLDNADSTTASIEQRRSTVSLRRGSNVGKRMNAAISSITGGGGDTIQQQQQNQSDSGGGSVAAFQLTNLNGSGVATVVMAAAAAASQPGGAVGQKSGANGEAGGTIGMVPPLAVAPKAPPQSALAIASSGIGPKAPAPRPSSAAGRGAGPRKAQGMSGRGEMQHKNSVLVTAGLQHPPVNAAVGGVAKMIPQQQQQQHVNYPPIPRVNCPETTALRERRDEIRIKLAKMLQDRHHRSEVSAAAVAETPNKPHQRRSSSFSLVSSPSVTRDSPSGQRSIPQSPAGRQLKTKQHRCVSHLPLWQGPDPAPQLPRRRKTHWDTVLEEMRWMATDFIEERKWKHSSARILGIQAARASQGQEQQAVVAAPARPDLVSIPVNDMKMETETLMEEFDDDKLVAEEEPMEMDDVVAVKDTKVEVDSREVAHNFHEVTAEDEIASRAVAKRVSGIVSDFVSANATTGPFSPSDSKATEVQDCATQESEGSNSVSAPIPDLVGDPALDLAMSGDPAAQKARALEKAVFLQQASMHVDTLLQMIKDGPVSSSFRTSNKESQSSPESHGFCLSLAQTEVVNTIEDFWQRIGAGAVLEGPVASGKTIATCSLLWRNRSLGPQLLVCSSASMIRWLHELGRLPDVNLKSLDSFGMDTGSAALGTGPHNNFGACDVFVCRHSLISEVGKELLAKFRSIVIDCRYPTGYAGSRSPTAPEGFECECNSFPQGRASAPDELSSSSWWSKIAASISVGRVNRLLIGKPDANGSLSNLRGLSNRQFLEVLALRAGILFGTKVFDSSGYSIKKALLAWSRHRIKGSAGSGSKLQQVSTLFTSLVNPFYCVIESGKKLEDGKLPGSGVYSWEVRRCKMTSGQAAAYDRACRQSRSALSRSFGVNENDPFAATAAALLRIRRHCTHSDIGGSLRAAKMRCLFLNTVVASSKKSQPHIAKWAYGSSSSQPNVELACRILAESGKLRHLVSILVHESGCIFVGDDSIDALVSEGAKRAPAKSKTSETKDLKKIVILAALPEIQVLVSVLLNSIGIEHEVLLRSAFCPALSSTIDPKAEEAVAWAQSQLILSKFNRSGQALRSNVSIVIASPVSVAGDHGGLGVEEADTIICLDEDWSGRGELLIQALVSRCRLKKESERKADIQLLRLVAESTCEETFLASTSETCSWKSLYERGWDLPVNAFGTFVAPEKRAGKKAEKAVKEMWQSRASNGDMFAFPGCNLFLQREEDLDDVCASNPLPQLLSSSDKLRFLPGFHDEDSTDVEMMIVRRLIEDEESASSFGGQNDFLEATKADFVPTLPPLLYEFPKSLVERLDLPSALSRCFLDRLSKNVTMEEVGVAASGSVLVLPNDSVVVVGGVPINDTSDLNEREARPISTKNPMDIVSSVLFYTPTCNRDEPLALAAGNLSQSSATSIARRVNLYSSIYSTSQSGSILHDGNQGSEALVYFPPIFPRMQECAALAKDDVKSLWSTLPLPDRQARNISFGAKQNDGWSVTNAEHQHSGANVRQVITEDEASHSDAASVLMDLFDDYGLAGMGALPLPRDSALTSGVTLHEPENAKTAAVTAQNDWLSSTPICDAEEFQASLQMDSAGTNSGSMILFVSRKRPRASVSQLGTSQLSRGIPTSWNGVSTVPSGSAFYPDLNGTGKKGKRPSVASAFNRIPIIMDAAQPARLVGQSVQRKDDYRHRLLSTLRQSGMGSTMFEAPVFRVSAVRVRNKVSDRLLRHGWTSGVAFDTGPGLPLIVSKQYTSSTAGYRGIFEADPHLWTSVVKRLQNKDAITGGEAIELSLAQRATLRRSLVAPCRVDFGPFQCGFLSSPSGMTAAALPKPRVGVSLPMGVKITPAAKEQAPLPWNGEFDRKLQSSAVRFGMNWILAARVLSGFQDVALFSQSESKTCLPLRAARSCRDRWQRLTRNDPSLEPKVQQPDRFSFRADAFPERTDPGRRAAMPHKNEGALSDVDIRRTIEFLLPPWVDDGALISSGKLSNQAGVDISLAREETPPAYDKQETPQRKQRRSFAAFHLANAKKITVPLSIPGVTSGSASVSHPSHDQAVQTSGGRTDMWPLQLLDAADRQRAAATASTETTASPKSTAAHQAALSSSTKTQNNGVSSISRSQTGSTSQQSQRSSSSSATAAPAPPAAPQRAQVIYLPVPSSNSAHSAGGSPPNQASTTSSSVKQSFAPPQPPNSATTSSSVKVITAVAKPPESQPSSNPDDRARPAQPQAKT